MEISLLKDNEYYLNVTRMLIAKYHPQNKDLVEEYNRLNKNLLNNLISHYKKCQDYKYVKRIMLIKEIGDKNETPHVHSIVVFEDKENLISFMKYIQTRILKAYKDDVSIIPKEDVKHYIYYIFKTFKPSWVEYKDYYCGNNEDTLLQWRLLFKKYKVRDEIIKKVTTYKTKVTELMIKLQEEHTKKIIDALIKDEEYKNPNDMFIDD